MKRRFAAYHHDTFSTLKYTNVLFGLKRTHLPDRAKPNAGPVGSTAASKTEIYVR